MPDESRALERAILTQRPWETGHLTLHSLGIQRLTGPPPPEVVNIHTLDLSANRLTSPPEWIMYLPRLQRLSMAGNRLTTLDGIASGNNLEALDISENRVQALPNNLNGCDQIRWLSMAFNRIENLTPLAALFALEALDVSRNRIKTLETLPSLVRLRRLDASSNAISHLWPSSTDLHSLRWLDLSRNRLSAEALDVLTGLPLTEFFIDHNNIQSAPPWLRRWRIDERYRSYRPFSATEDTQNSVDAVDSDIRGAVHSLIDTEPSAGLNFDRPPQTFAFLLETKNREGAADLLDLYYKAYPDLPATLQVGDDVSIPLRAMTRWSALTKAVESMNQNASARISLSEARTDEYRDMGASFAEEALDRIEDIELVSTATDGRRRFTRLRPSRVVNADVCDPQGRALAPRMALAPGSKYRLRVWIGPETGQSLVVNPAAIPLEELPPNSEGGWWFDLVATSPTSNLVDSEYRIFLPLTGASEKLDIPFRTALKEGPGHLRCTLYYANNAVQSLRLAFTIGRHAHALPAHAEVDFVLTHDLARAEALQPRRLNLLTNDSSSGVHTIVVKGSGVEAATSNVTESDAVALLGPMRKQLELITLGRDKKNQYDDDNAASLEQLTADLSTLAHHGWSLLQAAVPMTSVQSRLRSTLMTTSKIQISRAGRTVFPWALLYDGPRQGLDEWVPCELLSTWSSAKMHISEYPSKCPFGPHKGLNVLCPFSFWGFRHLIEQPPSVLAGQMATSIKLGANAHGATVRSLDLDEDLSRKHLRLLGDVFAGHLRVTECHSRDAMIAAINVPETALIYLYCHGVVRLVGDAGVDRQEPYLEIGNGEAMATGDLNAWALTEKWHPALWLDVQPLVFINGCHTAALSPEQVVDFVNTFAGANAAGVIGTEIAVAQPVASEFAQRFYEHLVTDSLTVGEAMRRARLDLLAKGNVAGLVYTSFCSMDLALQS